MTVSPPVLMCKQIVLNFFPFFRIDFKEFDRGNKKKKVRKIFLGVKNLKVLLSFLTDVFFGGEKFLPN
jgi:hypothetical protein